MDLQAQITLVNDMISLKTDRTIKDFVRVRNEMEKFHPTLQRITINSMRSEIKIKNDIWKR